MSRNNGDIDYEKHSSSSCNYYTLLKGKCHLDVGEDRGRRIFKKLKGLMSDKERRSLSDCSVQTYVALSPKAVSNINL